MPKLSKFTISGISLAIFSSISIAGEVRCVEVEQSSQPGSRSYAYDQGWVIYEDSLYRNLIDLSRLTGLKGIQPELGHDIHLPRRIVSKGKLPADIVEAINNNISGARIEVRDNLFWILPDQSGKVSESATLPCQTIYFEVKNSTLSQVMDELSQRTNWNIDLSAVSPLQKRMLLRDQVVKGSSYYDILAQLIVNTNFEVRIDDH